jgi:hypothetical protein
MSSEKVRYGQLYGYLSRLGYSAKVAPTHIVYRKAGRKLPAILPNVPKTTEVPPSHLTAVKHILMLDGVVPAGQLEFTSKRQSSNSVAQAKAKPLVSTKAARAKTSSREAEQAKTPTPRTATAKNLKMK